MNAVPNCSSLSPDEAFRTLGRRIPRPSVAAVRQERSNGPLFIAIRGYAQADIMLADRNHPLRKKKTHGDQCVLLATPIAYE